MRILQWVHRQAHLARLMPHRRLVLWVSEDLARDIMIDTTNGITEKRRNQM